MSWYRKNKPGVKVRDLVAHLLKGDQDAEVVVMDHFGHPLGMDLEDFNFRDYKKGDSPQGVVGWNLCVEPVDIGPDPE